MNFPKMFNCGCYGEAISVDTAYDGDTIDMSFWQSGWPQIPIRTRIRHILNILERGIPFTDMVVLSPEEAEKLGAYLIGEARRLKLKIACEEEATRGAGSTS